MDVRHQNILVSNHVNWELSYQNSQLPEESKLLKVAALVGTIACWPIFFGGSSLMLVFNSFEYCKARWAQFRACEILSNPAQIQKYSEIRIADCEKQIDDLKLFAIRLMEEIKMPSEVGLSIPQRQGILAFYRSSDNWASFSWNEFANTDFFQKSNVPNTPDKSTLKHLEKIRIEINFLSRQKNLLSNTDGRLEVTKKIVEMGFVKNGIKRQEAKEWIVRSIIWLFPSGVFWDLSFNRKNDQLTYEGNRSYLPAGGDWQSYDDLVDAHNKLVRNNDFLVPYIATSII